MKFAFLNLTETIRAMAPSIFAFVETTLPYTTPTPIAIITMISVSSFFGIKGFGAFLFVYSLEGIGLISTSKLVETIVDFIKGRNIKTLIMIVVLGITVYIYITILVAMNVKIHTEISDPNFSQALTLICYLPLLAGVLNGLSLVKIEYLDSVKEKKELDEKHYQDKREDDLKLKALKHGVNIFQQSVPMVIETPQEQQRQSREKHAGDFKEYVFEMLDTYGEIPLTEITAKVNKEKRVQFVHADVKGTWFKYVQQWKRNHTVK